MKHKINKRILVQGERRLQTALAAKHRSVSVEEIIACYEELNEQKYLTEKQILKYLARHFGKSLENINEIIGEKAKGKKKHY